MKKLHFSYFVFLIIFSFPFVASAAPGAATSTASTTQSVRTSSLVPPGPAIITTATSTVAVVVPNGRESWPVGSQQLLTWRTTNTFNYLKPTSFDIFVDAYKPCNKASCPAVTYSVARGLKNVTGYKWAVGKVTKNAKAAKLAEEWYRVRVCSFSLQDSRVCDVSNEYFKITASSTPDTVACPVGYLCAPGSTSIPQITGCPRGFVCSVISTYPTLVSTPAYTPAASPVSTPAPVATATARPTPRPTIAPTFTPMSTVRPTTTPTPTPTVRPTPTATPTTNPNITPAPTFTPWSSSSPIPTPTPTPSASSTNPPTDTTAPTIISISYSTVSRGSVRVIWDTSEFATSQVEYGTTASYGTKTSLDSQLVTTHSVVLSGLSDATSYQYRVISKDASGNTVTSTNFTFTTDVTPTPTPSSTGQPSPSSSPSYVPTATMSAIPAQFSQSATLWNATLNFFGLKK